MKRYAWLILFAAGLCHGQSCTTATCNATDCTQANVLAALPTSGNTNATVTVNIPACSATTWTSGISYTQPSAVTQLNIIGNGTPNTGTGTFGAGTLNTIITDNAGNTNNLFEFFLSYGQTLELENLNILPESTSTALFFPVAVNGTCTSSGCPQFRETNVEFGNGTIQWTTSGNGSNSSTMNAVGNVYGVIDHDTLPSGSDVRLVDVHFSAWAGVGQYGDNSWAQPDTYGTASNFFEENNVFYSNSFPFQDSEIAPENSEAAGGGGRNVARYNQITSASGGEISSHGTEANRGRTRGLRQEEAYGNTMTCTSGCGAAVAPRSGAAIMWGNSLINSGGSWNAHMNYYEARRGSGNGLPFYWGAGQGPYDQNTGGFITAWSITSNVVTFTASNTLSTGNTVLLNNFPTSTFFNGQTGTVLSTGLSSSQFEMNFTHANGSATESGNASEVFDSGTTTAGSQSTLTDSGKSWTTNEWQLSGAPYSVWDATVPCGQEILSNTATVLTMMNSSSSCTIGTGDTFYILQGTVLIDQPTRGQSNYISGATPAQGFPNNALDPTYQWADTVTGGSTPNQIVGDLGDLGFLANRDFYAQASGIQTSSTSPFNGTSGTGWGTLANRPTTCTTGVGYAEYSGSTFVQLDKCTATNTWTNGVYTPYTYPHPLTVGAVTAPGNVTPALLKASNSITATYGGN